jgi:hypothetical protein
MPWKEWSVMDERLQFVGRRIAGESMAELCREFGISGKTGYKIFERSFGAGAQNSCEGSLPDSPDVFARPDGGELSRFCDSQAFSVAKAFVTA